MGGEGCDAAGSPVPFGPATTPGGLPTPITGLAVVQAEPAMVRLEWPRPGSLGSLASEYRILQRNGSSGTFGPALRVALRGMFGPCRANASDPACLELANVTYGLSSGPDTCGQEFCVASLAGFSVYISFGPAQGQTRTIVRSLNRTIYVDYPFDLFPPGQNLSQSTFNVFAPRNLGGICCKVQDMQVVAFVAGLTPGSVYQFQVFAGNFHVDGFETIGSNIVTAYTTGLPNAVSDLRVLNLVGYDSIRLAWTDPGGPRYCGDRRFQVYELAGSLSSWKLLNGSQGGFVQPTTIVDGIGTVDLVFQGTPSQLASSGGLGTVSFYTVKTYCSTALGAGFGATYLESSDNAAVIGNVVPAILQGPPSGPLTGVRVIYLTLGSALLSWTPVMLASIYKVQLASSNIIVAGPWSDPGDAVIFLDWPLQDQPQIYRSYEANLTGLDPTKSYKFRVLAGSLHNSPNGTFPVQSKATALYVANSPPTQSDVAVTLYRFTSTSLTLRFNASASRSVDPADHFQPLFVAFLKISGQSSWSGPQSSFFAQNVSLGCSNVESENGLSVGRNLGCDSFTLVSNISGLYTFQYSFSGLPAGQVDDVNVQVFSLHSPFTKSVVYFGKANRCVCTDPTATSTILYGGQAYFFLNGQMKSNCTTLYLLQTSLSCSLGGAFLYLMPPASQQPNAYTGLRVFVRSGPGIGQEKTIMQYKGGAARLAILDSAWDISPNENSIIEVTNPSSMTNGQLLGSLCNTSTNCSILVIDNSSASRLVSSNYSGVFLFLLDGACVGQARRIIAIANSSGRAVVRVLPPFSCLPTTGINYSTYIYFSAANMLTSLVQAGPPLKVSNLSVLSVTYNSVVLQWDPTTTCLSGSVLTTPCSAAQYMIQSRQTHDSSNFPIQSNWSMQTFSTIPYVIFSGLVDMSSYEIRVSAKRDLSDDFGNWSDSRFVKLTSGTPALSAQILTLNTSLYNDRVLVVWSSDTNPPQADRFYITYGKSSTSMIEYGNFVNDQFQKVVFLDKDTCTSSSSNKVICQTYVVGLQMGTIYYFRVFSGNRNGFENSGSEIASSATLSLPTSPVLNFKLVQIYRSINISGFAVQLGWSRPGGWPPATKYYISISISGGAFFNSSLTVSSTNQTILVNVTYLTKFTQYTFRVHCGNYDGPIGFHPNMSNDPSASSMVTVVPDDVPGRPLLVNAQPTIPDQNTMIGLSWNKPLTGGAISYYTILFCKISGSSSCTPSVYVGCSATSMFCSSNPNCNPAFVLCVAPCMGARNEGPGSEGQPCQFTGMAGTVTGLDPGSQYQFNLSAVNDAGQGRPSYLNEIRAAALSLPTAVTGLNISAITTSTVRLDWFSGSCGSSCFFQVKWSSTMINGTQTIQTNYFIHAANLSARAAGISYRIYSGNSSTLFERFGAGVYLPASASNLNVASATESSLTFSFNPDPQSDTYQVWMSGLDSTLASRPVSEETQLSTVRVEGLKTWVPYRFLVKSKVRGRTPYDLGSAVLIAFASGMTSPPVEPKVLYTSSSQARLSWNQTTTGIPVAYKVLTSDSGKNSFGYPVEIIRSKVGQNEVTITELADNRSYDFKVFASSFQGYESTGSDVVAKVQPVDVPRDLSIRGVSTDSLTLQWLPPRLGLNPQAYRVVYTYNGMQKAIADVVHYGGDDAEQSALISSLAPGVYSFQVFSKSLFGFYEPFGSNRVFGAPMLAPIQLSAARLSFDSVLLAWQTNTSQKSKLSSYLVPSSLDLVYYDISSGASYGMSNLSIYTTNISLEGLTPNRRYQFIIRGVNSDGFTFPTIGSTSVFVTPIDYPLNLSIKEVNASKVTLAWLSPTNGVIPIAYRIEIMNESVTRVETAPHLGGFAAAQSYTVSGLMSGDVYRFAVAAQSGTGDYSDFSNSVSTSLLSPPSFLRASYVTAYSVSLVWNAPISMQGLGIPSSYIINHTSILGEGTSGVIQFGATSFTINGLKNKVLYRFCLFAKSDAGDYVAALGGCYDAVPIGQPQSLRVVNISFTSLTLEWDVPAEGEAPFSYQIQYSCGFGLQYQIVQQDSRFTYEVLVQNLAPNCTCWFVVFSNISGFLEPTGSNNVTVSPVGRASQARMCYFRKTEISLQWAAPSEGPIPSAYRLSYKPFGCTALWWQSCTSATYTEDIEHKGDRFSIQTFDVFALQENSVLEFRVHAKNDETGLYDPVGSNSVVAIPHGGRSDYCLDLPSPLTTVGPAAAGHVLVSDAGDLQKMQRLTLQNVTIETWIKFSANFSGGDAKYAGIAGTFYSYSSQYQQGAGHFGYGLFCVGLSCGIHIGTRTDLVTSVRGLCGSLVFPQPGCGQSGWTTGHRAMSNILQEDVWYHLAGVYDSSTGLLFLAVNGQTVTQKFLSAKVRDDGIFGPLPIYYGGERSVYAANGDIGATMPWFRMDWQIGRALIGDTAVTVDSAPYASFEGSIDEVRVWSFARDVSEIMKTSFLDTVPPFSAGLVGYWPFDDPIFKLQCADETLTVRDASVNNSILNGELIGTAVLVVSTVPLDRDAGFTAGTPLNGTQFTVYVGETIDFGVGGYDPNPSDRIQLLFQLPGVKMSPISAQINNITESRGKFSWNPQQLDAGKNISFCYFLFNFISNPLNPDFCASRPSLTSCVTIRVPLCRYKSRYGDTVRSIAQAYQINWQSLYSVNPEILSPDKIAPGTVCSLRIHVCFCFTLV